MQQEIILIDIFQKFIRKSQSCCKQVFFNKVLFYEYLSAFH
jgi:hypothetical protein